MEEYIVDVILFIVAILLIFVIFYIYFLPANIAYSKNHENKIAILVLNIILGYTGIAWLILFFWACSATNNYIKVEKTPTIAQEIEELLELKKKGIITKEEFNNKKAQLLNSDANTKET